MSQVKRQKTTNIENQCTSIVNTKFEQLPNEVILSCFHYLSFYDLFQAFSCLNTRLNELIIRQTNNSVNFSSIPDEGILTFCFQLHRFLTITNNYPLSISCTSDEHKFNLIMKDNLFQEKFSQMKSLRLFTIHAEHIYYAIFDERAKLYQTLEEITLDEVSEADDHSSFVQQLFSDLLSSKMKSLKYLNISFQSYSCGCEIGIQSRDLHVDLKFPPSVSRENELCYTLETLIIGGNPDEHDGDESTNTKISFQTLREEILPSLPMLKTLVINAIHFDESRNYGFPFMNRSVPETDKLERLNLTSIKIWTINGDDERNESALKEFFLSRNAHDGTRLKTFCINNEDVLESM